jgi:hypothetical protein
MSDALRLSIHVPERAGPRARRAMAQLLHRAHLPPLAIVPAHSADVALAWGAPAPAAVPRIEIPWSGLLDPAAAWQPEARALLAAVRGARSIAAVREAAFAADPGGARALHDLPVALAAIIDEWEALTVADRDEHGRFPATRSLLFQENVLNQPVADRIALALGMELRRLAGLPAGTAPRPWWFCPTFDIDSDGMFRGRAALRSLRQGYAAGGGALARVAVAGAATLAGLRRDPHLCIGETAAQFEALGIATTFFCQTHRAHRIDSYSLAKSRGLRRDVAAAIAAGQEVGLHSSYATPSGRPPIDEQWARLPEGHARAHRSHYLRENGKDAWRRDTSLADSTLGYAGVCGFRLGTCIPGRIATEAGGFADGAMEVPPCAMDVTLRYREGLDAAQSFERVRALTERAEEVGGAAVLIWHPHHLEEALWPRWREVVFDLVADARRRGARIEPITAVARAFRERYDSLARQLAEAPAP